MSKPVFTDCFEDFNGEEHESAEIIHHLRKFVEQVYFSDSLGRLVLGREIYDPQYGEIMQKISTSLHISDRKSYEEMDRKYNLTMY
jgi:hypothetical protein